LNQKKIMPAKLVTFRYVHDSTKRLANKTSSMCPYYFMTGPAGTGKPYIINLIVNILHNKWSNFLLQLPAGVFMQNFRGKMIHSELVRIISTQEGFYTYTLTNTVLKICLKEADTIIIDEISMISTELLGFYI
jgi:nucleoside-triphosphatase THEP1